VANQRQPEDRLVQPLLGDRKVEENPPWHCRLADR
jgi:hypothetical protein